MVFTYSDIHIVHIDTYVYNTRNNINWQAESCDMHIWQEERKVKDVHYMNKRKLIHSDQ